MFRFLATSLTCTINHVLGTLSSAGGKSAALVLSLAFAASAHAQTPVPPALSMITQPIVESNSVRLFGNVRPEAIAANDRGRVPDNLPMEHLLLQLKRPPAREQALQSLIDQLHDPRSPNYHHWLSAS